MDKVIKPSNKKLNFKILYIFVSLIAVLCIFGMFFFYNKYQQIKNSPDSAAKRENALLLTDIGKLMVLPVGEEPTVATVTDKGRLSDQVFFKDAQNGDKLVAYTVAKRAILYRPSTKKLINIAPFNIDGNNPGDSQ